MASKKIETKQPPATNDAYTGMLVISLFALIIGCVLLYLDYSQYPDSKSPTVPKAPAISTPAPADGGPPVAIVPPPVPNIEAKKNEEKKKEEKKANDKKGPEKK